MEAGWSTKEQNRRQTAEGRMGGRMRGQAWKDRLSWFPPSTQHTGRAAKDSGYQEVSPSSRLAQDPGALTLFPSGVGRSLPPFYFLQREGSSLEAG